MPSCIDFLSSMIKRPIIVIAGPTASGKSDISIALAKEINGVIINADSRQIYQELVIGTARPAQEGMQDIPHYLYGYVSVKDDYNLYKYQKDAYALIKEIPKEKSIILTGGTGLYIDSVIYNYELEKSQNDKFQRNKLSSLPLEELQKEIPSSILETLNNSERNNPRRLIRIIEKDFKYNERNVEPFFPSRYFVIDLTKEVLKEKVITRTNQMFEKGLEAECKSLWENGYYEYPALDSIGYKEFKEYFNGSKNLEDVKNEIISNTMKYIKRQKTWFKRNSDTIWTSDQELILKESRNLLKNV